MASFIREGFVSADISETFAGYYAHVTTSYKDGTVVSEDRVPCRTKDDAEEIVELFISGAYDA